jgi:SAM-dependent methyltransferase
MRGDASHVYGENFFAWNNRAVAASAQAVVAFLAATLQPRSVLDVGCAEGVWLRAWQAAGAERVQGVDGGYVDRNRLLLPPQSFAAVDLSASFDLAQRFDLVQSLEVAEHLPPTASAQFVHSIVRHGDVVLFSAAVVGQGGEHHVNERPLEYWRRLFGAEGFACFDPIRPAFRHRRDVQPWYRYNTLLYVNAAGCARLPASILCTEVPVQVRVREGGNLPWRARRAVLRMLPTRTVSYLANRRAAWTAATPHSPDRVPPA